MSAAGCVWVQVSMIRHVIVAILDTIYYDGRNGYTYASSDQRFVSFFQMVLGKLIYLQSYQATYTLFIKSGQLCYSTLDGVMATHWDQSSFQQTQ